MKKLISFFLIVSMVASVVAVPTLAFAEDLKFLVAESYNEQPTGATPGNGAVADGNARVVVTAEKKKKL